jgi:hypothetical protein
MCDSNELCFSNVHWSKLYARVEACKSRKGEELGPPGRWMRRHTRVLREFAIEGFD